MELKPKQLEAAILLASGSTITATAEKVGVARPTIHEWLGNNVFKAYLNRLKQESIDTAVSQIQNATCLAVETILKLMKNSPSDAVSLAAAKMILESTHVIDCASHVGSSSIAELEAQDRRAKRAEKAQKELEKYYESQ